MNNYNVQVVMPVRGRQEQTLTAMRRLINTATYQAKYVAVSGSEDVKTLEMLAGLYDVKAFKAESPTLTYWQALQSATLYEPDHTLIVTVANDVLPVIHWLRNAINIYSSRSDDPVIGFNGDGYMPDENGYAHSCHFMISARRVRRYGGWPIWYQHNFGDTEIIARAHEEGAYVKAPYAILYHDHPGVAGASMDDVYRIGAAGFENDRKLFVKRRNNQWIS